MTHELCGGEGRGGEGRECRSDSLGGVLRSARNWDWGCGGFGEERIFFLGVVNAGF